MKTFKEFIVNEAAHSAGLRVKDWGVIHPNTGKLVSAAKHPYATTHEKFKETIKKKNPTVNTSHFVDYIHYHQPEHGLTTHVRSSTPEQHKTLQKGLKNLPIANHYEHGSGDNHFHDFDNASQLKTHVDKLVNS